MRRLIVTADDLGADEPRNLGIAEALASGVVTSVSLLMNAPATDDAIERLRSLARPSVGVHLNLSEGAPSSRDLESLVDREGRFLGKARAHRLLESPDARLAAEIAREIEAQIEAASRAGLAIDHVDGHQHVHVFPAVRSVAIDAARRHGIRWYRLPDEPPDPLAMAGELEGEALRFTRLARETRELVLCAGLEVTDHFLGLRLKGRLTADLLVDRIARLAPGITELMVHPGRVPAAPVAGPFSSFSTLERERELEALVDPRVFRAIETSGVTLTGFPVPR